MKEINVNRISALLGFILSGSMIFGTRKFPARAVSATRYVIFLAVSLALLSLILLLTSVVKSSRGKNNRVKWIQNPVYFFETVIGIVIYFVLLHYLGFLIPSFLFLVVMGWLLGYRKPVKLILVSIALLASIYLVFVRFLSVPVPTGILGGLM